MESGMLTVKAQNCFVAGIFSPKYFKTIKNIKDDFRNSIFITHIYYVCCGTKTLNVSKKLQNMDTPRKQCDGKNVYIETGFFLIY